MVTRTRLYITLYVHCRFCVFLIPRVNSDCFVVTFTFTFLTVILQEWYHEHSQGLLRCHQYLESVSEATAFRPQAKTLILSNDRPKCNRHISINEKRETPTQYVWRYKFHIGSLSEVYNTDTVKGKGKAVPLQAWSGPEGSRKLRFPDFMTTAQDGGKVVSLTHRPPLPHRKYTWYSFLLDAESTPGP